MMRLGLAIARAALTDENAVAALALAARMHMDILAAVLAEVPPEGMEPMLVALAAHSSSNGLAAIVVWLKVVIPPCQDEIGMAFQLPAFSSPA